MEKINWKVEGMSCTNCALSVNKFLQEQGMQEVKVNFMGGDVSFKMPENSSKDKLIHGIQDLGYKVAGVTAMVPAKRKWFNNHLQRFWFCFIFTAPLMLHMVPGLEIHILMNPYLQLGLTIPVFLVGMDFFGRSALKSLRRGIPNMNVLIALGAVAAFGYSLYGTLIGEPDNYLFYESASTIITLVFLGNWMEDRSVEITQASLKKLAVQQQSMANMIAYDDQHQEHVFPVKSESLKVGDLLLIRAGEQVPMDCKILWGEASVNESLLSGESVPLSKKMNDHLIGGSIVESGTIKAYVTAVGEDTVLSGILRLVKDAQAEKPPVQQLADKISAIFVPTVISISLLSFLINYFFAQEAFSVSLLRSIAILVIACPCAMGLATPAAIAVGLGRAARNGILFRNAKTLELFRNIKQVVFDKTGTLTTGHFTITNATVTGNMNIEELQRIAFSLEKYSTHPIALAISREWKSKNEIRWQKIEEIKGLGMQATDKEGNQFLAGSFQVAAKHTSDYSHNVYILRNNELIGWIDVADEIRPEALEVVTRLHQQGIHTILLSGDKKEKSAQVAATLGIQEVYAEQNPQQKLETITRLNQLTPTAMVGDGINDAPALAKATVGISLSQSTQLAMQTATVVLMNQGLKNLPMALGLGKHTYQTIKENLFWAFAYNIVAIPIAA
ncbi:MAG: cadmium-translocating P-type ATPase, partial [Chitinophagaceae bacterium]|nr:cadmium-translocating P-type ATPase [Chitinophagaceae bacterium]